MGNYHSQQCPLCDTSADFRFNDSYKYKVFNCSTCKVFAISDTAERRLIKDSSLLKKDLSKESQKLKDTLLLKITAGGPGSIERIHNTDDPRSNWNT